MADNTVGNSTMEGTHRRERGAVQSCVLHAHTGAKIEQQQNDAFVLLCLAALEKHGLGLGACA